MSDYISREALIGKVEKHYCAPCKGQGGDLDGDWCRSCVINSVLEKVRGIPAADVAPVRHGRWEAWMPDKNGETREFICTGCRFMVEMSWKQKECDYEWCPYCGCKMDKEEADDKKQPEEAPGE